MRKLPMVAMMSAVLLAGCGEKEVAIQTDADKMSYGLGLSMARNVTSQGIEINQQALIAGIQDAISENPQRVEDDAIRAAFAAVREAQMEKQKQDAEAAVQEGIDYLATTAKKEGILATESGLLYEVLQAGEGASPSETDVVSVHYQGTLIDGSVFDSSIERGEPAKFPVNRVISGWTEALQLMKVGDKWRLHIPAALAYGEQSPSPKIPANSTLVFEVELLGIEAEKES